MFETFRTRTTPNNTKKFSLLNGSVILSVLHSDFEYYCQLVDKTKRWVLLLQTFPSFRLENKSPQVNRIDEETRIAHFPWNTFGLLHFVSFEFSNTSCLFVWHFQFIQICRRINYAVNVHYSIGTITWKIHCFKFVLLDALPESLSITWISVELHVSFQFSPDNHFSTLIEFTKNKRNFMEWWISTVGNAWINGLLKKCT